MLHGLRPGTGTGDVSGGYGGSASALAGANRWCNVLRKTTDALGSTHSRTLTGGIILFALILG